MGKMTLILPDELEREFRTRVVQKYGGRKGALAEAAAEAFELWLREEKKKK